MRCFDDETVERLVRGDLGADALDGVDAHMDACASCQRLVAALVATTGEPPAPAVLPRGTSVDRFVLLEPVGVGAMGAVYAAYDPRLDRRVAVKLLHARDGDDGAGDRGHARLLREAQAMARLEHVNVVRVYDVGEADGRVFVAMELVVGQSLRAWLAATPRSTARIVAAFVAAGRGLEAAHAAGLVHRDFKPDNVLVSEGGSVRVGDFGLASEDAPGRLPPSAALDRTGAIVGTPVYMAPEQIDGARADPRADQFSFCVALFEALEGRRPFAGQSLPALRAAIAEGPPALRRRDVPARVAAVVRRGLMSDPTARFESMSVLLAALEPPRARSRGAVVTATAALLLAALVAFFGLREAPCTGGADAIAEAWNAERRSRVHDALSVAAPGYGAGAADAISSAMDDWAARWAAAHDGVCRATRVEAEASEALLEVRLSCLARARSSVDVLARTLGSPGVVAVTAAEAARELPDLEACTALDRETDRPPPPALVRDEVASIERGLDEALAELAAGRVDDARAHLDALARRAGDAGWAPVEAETGLGRARALRASGALAEAEAAAAEATLAAEGAGEPRTLARLWALRAAIAGERGELDLALGHAEHAEAVLARAGRPAALEARVRTTLGTILAARGDRVRARAMLEDALVVAESAGEAERTAMAAALTELGNLAREAGALDEALARHERALAIDVEALGPGHPAIGRHLHNVAGVLRLRGELDLALERYQEALAIRVAALGASHPDVGLTENSIGLVDEARGDVDGARTHFERALVLLVGHAEEGVAARNLGLLELRAGDSERARTHLEDAARIFGSAHADERARALVPLAEAEAAAADHGRASEHASEALDGVTDVALRGRAEAVRSAEPAERGIASATVRTSAADERTWPSAGPATDDAGSTSVTALDATPRSETRAAPTSEARAEPMPVPEAPAPTVARPRESAGESPTATGPEVVAPPIGPEGEPPGGSYMPSHSWGDP